MSERGHIHQGNEEEIGGRTEERQRKHRLGIQRKGKKDGGKGRKEDGGKAERGTPYYIHTRVR